MHRLPSRVNEACEGLPGSRAGLVGRRGRGVEQQLRATVLGAHDLEQLDGGEDPGAGLDRAEVGEVVGDELELLHPPGGDEHPRFERADELARTISLEMGKPLTESQGEVELSSNIYRYYADNGPRLLEDETLDVPGFVSTTVYRMDSDANQFYMAVVFDDAATYRANAQSPEQDARYQQMVELLEGPPEWHDGEIVYSG